MRMCVDCKVYYEDFTHQHTCPWTEEVSGVPPTSTPAPPGTFVIKDSGVRETYAGGMVRDTARDKTNWALILDGPMPVRWAEHMTKGAIKYTKRNWMKGEGEDALERARESAARHFVQWYNGDTDEDHAAAVYFNINLAEYVKGRVK